MFSLYCLCRRGISQKLYQPMTSINRQVSNTHFEDQEVIPH